MLKQLFAVAVCILTLATARAQELPPYSPPAPEGTMTSYANADLGFSIRYPNEFTADTLKDLQSVLKRGHKSTYGTEPTTDKEHQEAMRCMRPLLYATSKPNEPSSSSAPTGDESPDTILILDVDKTCVPKSLKGDKALTQIAGTLLNLPGMSPLVPQTWFAGGGNRRIHSGMAGGMIAPPTGSGPAIAEYIAAASFEQKEHWILVAYLNGTRNDGVHKTFPYSAVSFEDGKPILLFPFLLGHMNVVK